MAFSKLQKLNLHPQLLCVLLCLYFTIFNPAFGCHTPLERIVLNFDMESGKLHKNSIMANIISAQRRQNPRYFIVVNYEATYHIFRIIMKQYTLLNNERLRLFAYTPLFIFRCPICICFVRSSLKARDNLIYMSIAVHTHLLICSGVRPT